jgi:murein DD-endopeptidase MepM/ murein hydrolase activator NlpD
MINAPSLQLKQYLQDHPQSVSKVVDFDPAKDKLLQFDFTANNRSLTPEILADTTVFSAWIDDQLSRDNSRYGIGGYNEHRTIYARSELFDTADEPRRLHLGVDIWGPAGTPVYNPLQARVHSFHFNDHFGDYGATIILEHQLGDLKLHSLYGHLNLASLQGLQQGMVIEQGQQFTAFGIPQENGHWPPHLHFQLIWDMHDLKGNYPGVCRFTQRESYLENCPDPNDILAFSFWIK